MASPAPTFSFGVVSDVQYADIPDGYNFTKTRKRYFRHALQHLHKAVHVFKQKKVDFVLQLGDLIDGYCKENGLSQEALSKTITEINKVKKPVYHIIGNHDLYNFSRAEILKSPLNSAILPNVTTKDPSRTLYYHFSPVPGFRVVILDSYDISILGYDKDDPIYKEAKTLLTKYNKNENLNNPNVPSGYSQYVAFNGGVGEEQLQWLEEVLTQADKAGEEVLVAAHIPLTLHTCTMWNYPEVLDLLHRHPSVKVYLSGHGHCYNYCQDAHGIHHVVWPAILETAPGTDAFGIVNVYGDRVEVQGYGEVESSCMQFHGH